MNDEPELQLVAKDENASLILSEARTGLVARGRADAATLQAQLRNSSLSPSESQRLAEQGNAEAQGAMGDLLHDSGTDLLDAFGEGEKSDQKFAEAAYWYAKAADQGHVRAQRVLGALYLTGLGVEADGQKSNYWLCKAADQGDRCAQTTIEELRRSGIWPYIKSPYWDVQAEVADDLAWILRSR